jgi:radical SAM superfamily enzyme
MLHGIIFTGMTEMERLARPAGAFRMRTWLEKKGYNIEVIDFFLHFSNDEIEKICHSLIDNNTLFVGVSTTFLFDKNKINFLTSIIKRDFKHVKVILGGTETEMNGADTSNIDRIIWGYSEEAMIHYLDFLSGKRLDDLNWIAYYGTLAIDAEKNYKNDDSDLTILWKEEDLLSVNYLPIEISRGCIFRCRFCQYPLLGKKKNDYIRHEDNLVDEFRRNWEKWGINNYSFQDDTFNDNIVKLEYVANAIKKSNVNITYTAFLRADLLATYPETIPILTDTGLVSAMFGIETFHEGAKKAIGKGMDNEKQFAAIKELKSRKPIHTFTGMIIGLPSEPIESVYKSQEWFINQNEEVFNGWRWFPLGIRGNDLTRRSQFELEYEKWGYTINLNPDDFYSNWSNDLTNIDDASQHARILNTQTDEVRMSRLKLDNLENWHLISTEWYNFAGGFLITELIGLGLSIENILTNFVFGRSFQSIVVQS